MEKNSMIKKTDSTKEIPALSAYINLELVLIGRVNRFLYYSTVTDFARFLGLSTSNPFPIET